MEQKTMEELRALVSAACSSPDIWMTESNQALYAALLQKRLSSATAAEQLQCEQLLDRLAAHHDLGRVEISSMMNSIAYEAYLENELELAEYGFRLCVRNGSEGGRNNLAYLLRRHHKMDTITKEEIIDLLIPGVKTAEPFSLVNMALFFALNLGTDEDWQTADQLFGQLSFEPDGVMPWWSDLAEKGDLEGYLVFLWMIRHNKLLYHDSLGTEQELAAKVRAAYPSTPEWLFEKAPSNETEDKSDESDDS